MKKKIQSKHSQRKFEDPSADSEEEEELTSKSNFTMI